MRITDLSLPLGEDMPVFPSPFYPKVEISGIATHERDGRSAQKLVLNTHLGTHVDAPLHFVPKGSTVDKIPLEKLAGRPVVIPLVHKRAREAITREDLERANRDVRGRIVLLGTGWTEKHWGSPDYYSTSPYLTLDAAQWLVDHGAVTVGNDALTEKVEPGKADFPVHRLLLGNGMVSIEYLTNLSKLVGKDFLFVALPLLIEGGDGSPARAIAIEL